MTPNRATPSGQVLRTDADVDRHADEMVAFGDRVAELVDLGAPLFDAIVQAEREENPE